MAILGKNDEYRLYRYKVNKLYLLFLDETMELEPSKLNSFSILRNYLEDLYPVIKMDLALEQSTYNKIIANKETMKVRIDIRKYYMKGTSTKKSIKSKHLAQTFTLILDDAVNTITESAHNKEYPSGDENEMNAVNMGMELFLFAGDLIKRNTTNINKVLRDSSVVDALGYILYKIGEVKDLIMPVPDNMTIYPELVIPSLKLSEALSFVDSYYGVFRNGTIIFFDVDRNYILPFCKRCGALASGEQEVVNIVVPKSESKITDKLCSAIKKSTPDAIYIIADANSFEPTNKSVSGKILQAENVEVIDNDTGYVHSVSTENKKVVIRPGLSDFYKDSYKARVQSQDIVINIALKNCDLATLTPNKIYQFLFEDTKLQKKYKGYYHLVNLDISYVKEEKNLTGAANCTFNHNVN